MIPGFPTTCPPGKHEDFYRVFKVDDLGDGVGARVTVLIDTPYANRYHALICDNLTQGVLFLKDGVTRKLDVFYDPSVSNGSHIVSVAPLGYWDSVPPGVDITIQQDYFQSGKGLSAFIIWNALTETKSFGDSSQFSNWNLTGLSRFSNIGKVNSVITEAQLDIIMSTDSGSGITTVTLQVQGIPIASGSITGSGLVTLSQLNSSGVSGTVTLTYTNDLAGGTAYLRSRWPKAYKVYADSVLVKTITDIGRADNFSARIPLASGTHSIQIKSVSDTGVESALSSAYSVTIPGRPNAPSLPVYVSGNFSNTALSFNSSNNASTTYVFDSALDSPVNLDTAAVTVSGIGKLNVTLPSIPSSTGIRRVALSAVDQNGIQDGNYKSIEIEYLSGTVVLPRPNTPFFKLNRIESGTRLYLDFNLSTIEQSGQASKVQMFLQKDGLSGIDYTSPVSSMNVGGSLPIKYGTISGIPTVSGNTIINDFYYCSVRASTLSGTQSTNVDKLGPFWLSSIVPSNSFTITSKILY